MTGKTRLESHKTIRPGFFWGTARSSFLKLCLKDAQRSGALFMGVKTITIF